MKDIKFTIEKHTCESTYIADMVKYVELFYFNTETKTIHSSFIPEARNLGKFLGFKHELLLKEGDYKKGYYFMNHINKTGNF